MQSDEKRAQLARHTMSFADKEPSHRLRRGVSLIMTKKHAACKGVRERPAGLHARGLISQKREEAEESAPSRLHAAAQAMVDFDAHGF
jgi:hypothetical protein